MSTVLAIAHHIFLTRDECYDLLNNVEKTVLGVSLPVWLHKGDTSEPALEVFCNYKITNVPGPPQVQIGRI
jgi:hypothetical protein